MGFWDRGSSGREWERWVNHYASFHRILLVGEGDFSFALCLALSFGSASNIVATSLDSYDDLISKYKRGFGNLNQLKRFGATLIFGVDATTMKYDTRLHNCRFDRIVYNFPHAGFRGKEDDPQVIRMHQELVEGFFRNAAEMLQPQGEVHVSHKITKPFSDWNIEELAFRNSLKLWERVDFHREDYPGYENKRGDGYKADDLFPLGECCTYKFVLDPVMSKMNRDAIHLRNHVSEFGCLRFNICGFAISDPGLAGCAGVLIDEYGVYRSMFSAPLGILDYEVAELRAFEAALYYMLLRSNLIGKKSVLIRSSSFGAVSWINNPSIRPSHLLKHFIKIDSMLSLNTGYGVRIEFISREDNRVAETYAKKAILLERAYENEL